MRNDKICNRNTFLDAMKNPKENQGIAIWAYITFVMILSAVLVRAIF